MIANTIRKAKTLPGSNNIVVIGCALVTVGLLGFLTINGSSGIPSWVQTGVPVLIVIGLLLSITGILKLRSEFDRTQVQVRNGLFMYGLALVILLFGVGLSVILNSLSGFLTNSVFLVTSSILALVGIITLRKKNIRSGISEYIKIDYLLLGTILMLAGVGLGIVSNIESFYTISQFENIVYVDIGNTISAYGCVISAYAFLNFPRLH